MMSTLFRRVAVASCVACVAVFGLAAETEGVDEDAFFGSAPAASAAPAPSAGADATVDEDAFFGSGPAASAAPATGSGVSETYQESFLKSEPVRIGGQYRFSMDVGMALYKPWADWTAEYFFTDPLTKQVDNPDDAALPAAERRKIEQANPEKKENSKLDLSGNVWFLARPSSAIRFFGKATFAFPFGIDAVSLQGYNNFIKSLNTAGSTGGSTVDSALASAAKDSGVTLPNLKIWEMYSDIDISDAVFIRAGKQMVKWGVGYFFQPADIISLSAVDVNDPSAEREGPLAIKANIPIDIHNLDFYVIAPAADKLSSVLDLKPAVRGQVVLGGWELGLGASVNYGKNKATVLGNGNIQYDRDLQAQFIATASGSIWQFNLFGEALVQRYQPGLSFKKTAYSYDSTINAGTSSLFNTTPTGFELDPVTHLPDITKPIFQTGTNSFDYSLAANRDEWLFSGTAGLRWSNSDIYLNVLAQYYFNGAGYDSLPDLADDAARYLVASSDPAYKGAKLGYADIAGIGLGYTGKHYVALNVSETFAKNSDITLSAYWLWNLSDLSGMVRPSLGIRLTDEISLGINTMIYYGDDNTQYRGIKQAVKAVLPAAMADQANAFELPRFTIGASLSIGGGSF